MTIPPAACSQFVGTSRSSDVEKHFVQPVDAAVEATSRYVVAARIKSVGAKLLGGPLADRGTLTEKQTEDIVEVRSRLPVLYYVATSPPCLGCPSLLQNADLLLVRCTL